MADMVGSAVVQEVVSGAFSFIRNNHEEIASQSYLLERLKLAHLDLKFALERTKKMPITEVSMLQRRMMIKHAFEESHDFVYKQQGVTLAHSLPNRIVHVVKTFFGTEKGSTSESCVRRFEFFAEKTDRFVRDVESGCSLALYRFSCPLITQLLQGKWLHYEMVSGGQTQKLSSSLEDYGAVAVLMLGFRDLETPMKYLRLVFMLRLSESTDIVGISTKCLQSLEQRFKIVRADVASGELAQISTQVLAFQPEPAQQDLLFNLVTRVSRSFRQNPLCCIGDGYQPSANNILSNELTERFSEQVSYVVFQRFISADEYNLQSSTGQMNKNTINAWPILQLSVEFLPHSLSKTQDDQVGAYLVTPVQENVAVLMA